MPETTKMHAIVDSDGRILAVHLGREHSTPSKEDRPSAAFVPLAGQRTIDIEVPREALNMRGPDLHQFLAKVKVNWPADVQIPEIKIVRKHEK